MAYYDSFAAADELKRKAALKKLISFLEDKNKGNINPHAFPTSMPWDTIKDIISIETALDKFDSDAYYSLQEIRAMQNTIKQQEEKLEKYNNFFSTLSSFLPKKSSIHDIIG